MIDYQVLRNLVLESLKMKPETQFVFILNAVKELAAQYDVFPNREVCEKYSIEGYHQYYRMKQLKPIDEDNVNQIVWDLIVDRVLTVGINATNPCFPHVRLTEFGHSVVNQESPAFYDPEGYTALLDSFTPQIDRLITQYAIEGLNCFRRGLVFAAAVMFGAAAESAVLILLAAIEKAETNTKREEKIKKLLTGQTNLPETFKTIQDSISRVKKTIPYSIHQGSSEHLFSLFEMIRVQRNDAVHPTIGQVNKTKVFLTIQTFPAAIELIYRLVGWFSKNKI